MRRREDCSLRAISRYDLAMVLHWRNSDRVRINMLNDHMITPEEHLNWFERLQTDPSDRYYIYREKDKALGVVYFNDIHSGHCDWGFYVGEETAPKGTGTALGFFGLNEAFGPLHITDIDSRVFEFNNKSLSFHEKMGFRKTGRSSVHHRRGQELPLIHFHLSRKEWEEVRPTLETSLFAKENV